MRLTDLLGAFRRRFVILIIGLLITAGAVFAVVQRVEPTYTSQASLVLLPPRSAVAGGSNPYLSLQGLTQALDVLTIALDARVGEEIPRANDRRIDLGPDLSGSAFNRNTDGPILQISVRTTTADSSMQYLQDTIGLVSPTLATMQDDLRIPTNAQVYAKVIASDTEPTISEQPRVRAGFVVFIGFFVLTCLIVVIIDRALVRRKATRAAWADAKAKAGASPDAKPGTTAGTRPSAKATAGSKG